MGCVSSISKVICVGLDKQGMVPNWESVCMRQKDWSVQLAANLRLFPIEKCM
jgi:hypothetical protein